MTNTLGLSRSAATADRQLVAAAGIPDDAALNAVIAAAVATATFDHDTRGTALPMKPGRTVSTAARGRTAEPGAPKEEPMGPDPVPCQHCTKPYVRTGSRQLYCPACLAAACKSCRHVGGHLAGCGRAGRTAKPTKKSHDRDPASCMTCAKLKSPCKRHGGPARSTSYGGKKGAAPAAAAPRVLPSYADVLTLIDAAIVVAEARLADLQSARSTLARLDGVA